MTHDKLINWLCLKSAPDLGPKGTLELLSRYPNPEEFIGRAEHALYQDDKLKQTTKEHLINAILPDEKLRSLELIDKHQISNTFYGDADYPSQLYCLDDPPLILYYRGDFHQALSGISLAVVGTRRPSAYGVAMCEKLLKPLCEKGVSIISGLAMGIDTTAHQAALKAKSKTIAVLASGLETIYPPMNRTLSEKIVENGALFSEYDPGSKMERWNFPNRNRIVSALANAVLVVEGPIDSGAMLTANFARQQGKPLYALPGNINNRNAQGPNLLIRNGAIIVCSAQDLLTDFALNDSTPLQQEIFTQLSAEEQSIYDLLAQTQQELSFDEFIIKTGHSFGKLSVLLLNLELKGLIAKSSGNSFIKI
jgi:DNA processing protein